MTHRRRNSDFEQASTRETKSVSLSSSYKAAMAAAVTGNSDDAYRSYERLILQDHSPQVRALIENDLAVLAVRQGDTDTALAGFASSLQIDEHCEAARRNLALLETYSSQSFHPALGRSTDCRVGMKNKNQSKVAVLSFLFNWPSTGGGIIHTVELAKFLARDGFDVRHFIARQETVGIGKIDDSLPVEPVVIDIRDSEFCGDIIKRRFRDAVDDFAPDWVIITDSWNTKPLIASAMQGYKYILRFQALECFCPLNNLRLLSNGQQCMKHQFATPEDCYTCLRTNAGTSGTLHQIERELVGVGTPQYFESLVRAVHKAEAVFVVNPLTAEMIGPYAQRVSVVPSGFDPKRFPWPWPAEPTPSWSNNKKAVFVAALLGEYFKGWHVVRDACEKLWQRRDDFQLIATGENTGETNDLVRFVGWLSQEELPKHLRAADIVVCPTIAQDALGRTAVEAMGVGRPVLASRIGGLPNTVPEGGAGLLFEPGNADDLAGKLNRLLDDSNLRQQLGQVGRKRFEDEFSWDVIIQRHYRPLLATQ